MILKPKKPGTIIRRPDTLKPLKEAGEKVELNTYWRRRLTAGDVVEVLQPEPAKYYEKKKTKKGVEDDNLI